MSADFRHGEGYNKSKRIVEVNGMNVLKIRTVTSLIMQGAGVVLGGSAYAPTTTVSLAALMGRATGHALN